MSVPPSTSPKAKGSVTSPPPDQAIKTLMAASSRGTSFSNLFDSQQADPSSSEDSKNKTSDKPLDQSSLLKIHANTYNIKKRSPEEIKAHFDQYQESKATANKLKWMTDVPIIVSVIGAAVMATSAILAGFGVSFALPALIISTAPISMPILAGVIVLALMVRVVVNIVYQSHQVEPFAKLDKEIESLRKYISTQAEALTLRNWSNETEKKNLEKNVLGMIVIEIGAKVDPTIELRSTRGKQLKELPFAKKFVNRLSPDEKNSYIRNLAQKITNEIIIKQTKKIYEDMQIERSNNHIKILQEFSTTFINSDARECKFATGVNPLTTLNDFIDNKIENSKQFLATKEAEHEFKCDLLDAFVMKINQTHKNEVTTKLLNDLNLQIKFNRAIHHMGLSLIDSPIEQIKNIKTIILNQLNENTPENRYYSHSPENKLQTVRNVFIKDKEKLEKLNQELVVNGIPVPSNLIKLIQELALETGTKPFMLKKMNIEELIKENPVQNNSIEIRKKNRV